MKVTELRNFDGLLEFSFGNTPELADDLLRLVIAGQKTATCCAFDAASPISAVGDRQIVLDGAGRRTCVIEITEVTITLFDQVTANFAYLEGEGDRSLQHWRTVHEAYFRCEGKFMPDMPLLCETFRVVDVL